MHARPHIEFGTELSIWLTIVYCTNASQGTKTVYTRGAGGETVTVDGVPQTYHPWLCQQGTPAQITELDDHSA